MCALGTGDQTCALPIFLLGGGELKRAELAGALAQHVQRETGAAELAVRVRGVAAVEQVAHLHHRDLVALGQDQLAAVGQGGVLQVGEVELRERVHLRSEEHTSELQSLMRISYAVFCLKKKTDIFL